MGWMEAWLVKIVLKKLEKIMVKSIQNILVIVLALLLPLLLPLVQFGLVYRLWAQHEVDVKRDYCQNSCWDTIFKVGKVWKLGCIPRW